MKTLKTECDCHDPAHIMVFSLCEWNDGLEPELYVSCQLNPRWGFWGRLWNAIRYIFGRQSRFGHWNEGSITAETAKALIPMLARLIDLDQSVKSGTSTE